MKNSVRLAMWALACLIFGSVSVNAQNISTVIGGGPGTTGLTATGCQRRQSSRSAAATRITAARMAELAALCSVEHQLVANEEFHRIIGEAAGEPAPGGRDARRGRASRARSAPCSGTTSAQRAESLICHRRLVARVPRARTPSSPRP